MGRPLPPPSDPQTTAAGAADRRPWGRNGERPAVRPGVTHVYHQYTIRVRERDAFADRLRERGVGSGVYYPIPVHRQKPYEALGYGEQSFPVTDRLSDEVLSIPVHPALSDTDVDAVIAAVNETAAELGPLDAKHVTP